MSATASERRYDVGGVWLPQPFKAGRLGHFGLYTPDVERARDFYTRMLGLVVTDTIVAPNDPARKGVFLTYGADHHALVLMPAIMGMERDDRYSKGMTANQISFQVGTLEEVVNASEAMKERGVTVWRVGRDVPGSNWAVYFLDPDGYTIELFYGMEQIGWDRRSKPTVAFRRYGLFEAPALPQPAEREEIADVVEAGDDLSVGNQSFQEGEAKFEVGGVLLPRPFKIVRGGPLLLYVADVDRSVAFYEEVMGFQLTETVTFEGHRAAYMRTGTEHHILALVPIALRDRLGTAPNTTLLAHAFQLGSYRQLRDAATFLRDAGCRLLEMPGALRPGVGHALHVEDPDGHAVMLYAYMEQVGWDGRPRPAAERADATEWPETIEAPADVYADRSFQGPIG